MTKYLLTCECGKNVPVEPGQAGGRVACVCGAELDVPPLRKLRHLPVAAPVKEARATNWNVRRGLVTVFGLLAVLTAIAAAWIRLTEAKIPQFDAAQADRYLRAVDAQLQKETPAEAWQRWIGRYKPLAYQGFTAFEFGDAAKIEKQIAQQRFLQRSLWVIAGVFALFAIAAALWPGAEKTRRQGDKETRRMN